MLFAAVIAVIASILRVGDMGDLALPIWLVILSLPTIVAVGLAQLEWPDTRSPAYTLAGLLVVAVVAGLAVDVFTHSDYFGSMFCGCVIPWGLQLLAARLYFDAKYTRRGEPPDAITPEWEAKLREMVATDDVAEED